MYRLRLFGGISLEGHSGPVGGSVSQRQPLALLSLLAASSNAALSRDKLVAYLWPETDAEHARHRLSVMLHTIRKTLGAESVLSVGDDLRLNPEVLSSDVSEFQAALENGDWASALDLYAGPLLDGFHLSDAPAFERWLDGEQGRFATLYTEALESLAEQAETEGDAPQAVKLWRKLAAHDPYSSRIALRLMQALEAAGDRPGALQHAQIHKTLVQEELGVEPDPEVAALAGQLRVQPPETEIPASFWEAAPAKDVAGGAGRDRASPILRRGIPAAEEPRKRIHRPVLLVMSTLALLLVGALVLRTRGADDDPRADTTEFVLRDGRVFVGLFENRTGDPELDVLGLMAADWIAQSLARTGLVEVVPAVTALQDLTSFELAERPADGQAASLALAKMARARFLVSGSYHGSGDTISFQAQILDVGTGRLVRSVDRVSGPAGEPARVLEDLRQRTAAALATAVDPRLDSWAGAVHDPPSLEAYRLYSAGLDTFLGWMQRAGNPSQAMREAADYFHEAAALDSSFISPLLWAFYAHDRSWDWPKRDSVVRVVESRRDLLTPWESALLDAQLSSIQGDWAGQYEAYKRVVELSPASEWQYRLGDAAFDLRRYREAAEILSALDPDRGWVSRWEHYWWTLTQAHHLAGDHEAELQAADRYLERYPESGVGLRRKAIALVVLGRTEEAAELAVQFSETDPPGVHSTLVWSVVMELRAHGHEAAARDLVDGYLVWYDSLPSNGFDARHLSTVLLVLGGRQEKARRLLEETVRAADHPASVLAALAQLGWIAALQGDEERARSAIARIEAEGDSAFSAYIKALTAGIVANLGESERAVALLQAAYQSGFPDTYGWHSDPALDPLRDYPPFEELVRPRE